MGCPSQTPGPAWVDVCGPTDWISPSSLMVHHHGWDLSLTFQHGGPVLTAVESARRPQGGGDSTCRARGLTLRRGRVTDSCPSGDRCSDPRTLFTVLQPSPAKPSVRQSRKAGLPVPEPRALGAPRPHSWDHSHRRPQSPAPVTIEGAVGTGLLCGEKSPKEVGGWFTKHWRGCMVWRAAQEQKYMVQAQEERSGFQKTDYFLHWLKEPE